MIAQLHHSVPRIFTTPSPDGTLFRCSEAFVKKFINHALGWSLRCSMRAGGKIPTNVDEILTKAYLHMAYSVKDKSIPPELMANSDQTQLTLAQGCHMTYAKVGSKQVSTIGTEEKRAITVMVTLTNDSKVLPFQVIYKGSTATSLPSKNCRSRKEAEEAGFLLKASMTKTYWSTQQTMKNFVNKIMAPHFDSMKVRLSLPPDQRSLWQIDCWSVHRSDEFLNWMGKNHETILTHFVPACMTGLFQPCDVGFQHIFKHSLKKCAHEDVVEEVLSKLEKGQAVQDIKADKAVGVLRDRTVHWLWMAHQSLNKPEIVKKVC
jgi:DDE superfamily endonuclease